MFYVQCSLSAFSFMIIIELILISMVDYLLEMSLLIKLLNKFQYVLQMIVLVNVLFFMLFNNGLTMLKNIIFNIGLHMNHLLVMFKVMVYYHIIFILIY